MSRAVVLVVGVGVDDDVGAELQRGVEARLEARGQALVVRQPDDVVDAVLAGDLDRAVGRAVVDDQPLDDVEAGDLAREVGQRRRERVLLVEARDLDDQLHRARRATCAAEGAPLRRPVRYRTEMQRVRPCRTAGRTACVAVLAGRPRAGHAGRVPRLPDLSQLRQLLLADLGRELLHGDHAVASTPTARPTEHPLAIVVRRGAVARWATGGDRVMVCATLASFVVLAAGLYRLGRGRRSRRSSASLAAALLCTRFDFPFLAARGYIDIPYLAFVDVGGGAGGRAPAARPAGVRAAGAARR